MRKILVCFLLLMLCASSALGAGDSFQSAETLGASPVTEDAMDVGTEHFYKLTAEAGELISITLNNTAPSYAGGYSAQITLSDSTQTKLIEQWDLLFQEPETWKLNWLVSAGESGTYYITYLCKDGIEGCDGYTLPAETTDFSDIGGKEAGSVIEDAIVLPPGTHEDCCHIAPEQLDFRFNPMGSDLVDYYKVPVQKDDVMFLLLDPGRGGEGSFTLEAYDDSRTELASEKDVLTDTASQKSLRLRSSQDQDIYFKVTASTNGNDPDDGAYSLTLEVEGSTSDDLGSGKDAGDTFAEAVELTAGTAELPFVDDVDYYTWEVPKDKEVSLRLIPPEDKRITATLYDENKQVVYPGDERVLSWLDTSSAVTGLPGETLNYHFVSSKNVDLYLKIEQQALGLEQQALGTYEVQLSTEDVSPEIQADLDSRSPSLRNYFIDMVMRKLVHLLFGVLNILFVLYCLHNIFTAKNNPNWKAQWAAICFFGQFVGCIIYLLFGKKKRNKEKTLEKSSKKQKQKEVQTTNPLIARLLPYIRDSRSRGASDSQIKKTLLEKGWDESLVDEALRMK